MTKTIPDFERLTDINQQVIDEFIPLLGQLSTSFARKDPDQQHADVMVNLGNMLESPDLTAVFVHRDEGKIISTATANLAVTPDVIGWVDDVVTLDTARGRGLGRGAMLALHAWFRENDAPVVRLTSSYAREEAGNLYEDLGYKLGGEVWRAPIEVSPDDEPNPALVGASRIRIESAIIRDDREARGIAFVNDCEIPTGHKAWIDVLQAEYGCTDIYTEMFRQAHDHLAFRGVTSANVVIDSLPPSEMLKALKALGYRPRDTRLYTIGLRINAA